MEEMTTIENTTETTKDCQDPQCEEEQCGSEQSPCPENKKTEQEKKIEELTTLLQRLQADFDNYRKRTEKEHAAFREYATRQLLTDLLPVLENFELAIKTVQDEGIIMIHTQLVGILEKYGLQAMETIGKKFDPKLHEALLQKESDAQPNTIVEELQKGYIVGNVVLRPARVVISTKNNETTRLSTSGTESI